MNITFTSDLFQIQNIYFSKPIKNNIMENSNFVRIYYSSEHFNISGIVLEFTLEDVSVEPYYQRYKCNFPKEKNKNVIQQIKNVESQILHKYKKNIQHSCSISDQMDSFIKLYVNSKDKINNKVKFYLKISGIWDNQNECGLTFKFIPNFDTHPS